MKTKIAMLIALLFAVKISTNAQQGMQRRTVEERVKSTMDKLTTPLNLDTLEQSKTSAVFTDFYTAQDKMREDARASGNRPDRSVFEKMTNDRDEKLKVIANYGSAYVSLRDNLEFQRKQLNLLKTKYEETKVDVEQILPQKFIVSNAFPAEKKSYPVRWIIVLVSALATLLIAVIVILLIENSKQFEFKKN